MLDKSGKDGAKCLKKVASGRKVAGAIRVLVNARSSQRQCAKVLHEGMFVSALMYWSETLVWRKKERSNIRAAKMDNFRRLSIEKKNENIRLGNSVQESVVE